MHRISCQVLLFTPQIKSPHPPLTFSVYHLNLRRVPESVCAAINTQPLTKVSVFEGCSGP